MAVGSRRLRGTLVDRHRYDPDAVGKGGVGDAGLVDDEEVLVALVPPSHFGDEISGKAPKTAPVGPARAVDGDPHRRILTHRPQPGLAARGVALCQDV